MRESLRSRFIEVCDAKIAEKGEGVGLSFYAFFANKNSDPELLWKPPRGGLWNNALTISKRQFASNH
jgi:Family of unknown function (DUF6500)